MREVSPDAGVAIFGAMMLIWIVLAVASFALFLWALIDCVQREFRDPTMKIVWILVIILIGFIGPIVYLIAGRSMGEKRGQTAAGPPPPPPS